MMMASHGDAEDSDEQHSSNVNNPLLIYHSLLAYNGRNHILVTVIRKTAAWVLQ